MVRTAETPFQIWSWFDLSAVYMSHKTGNMHTKDISSSTFRSIMNNGNKDWEDPAMAVHIVHFYHLQFITHSHPLHFSRSLLFFGEILTISSPCKITLTPSTANICYITTSHITNSTSSTTRTLATQLSSS